MTVDELVLGVQMALGKRAVAECRAFDPDMDGLVKIDELVQGVTNAVYGCGVVPPTRTVTPTATTTPTRTATLTPTNTPRATSTTRPTATATFTWPPTWTPVFTMAPTPMPPPTDTPEPPATPEPTATPEPLRACPFDFTDVVNLDNSPCFFDGGINDRCGGGWGASWISDGEFVIGVISNVDYLVYWGGAINGLRSSELLGFALRSDFDDLTESSGEMNMDASHQLFGILPDLVPFRVDGCPFLYFIGAYLGRLEDQSLAGAARSVEPPSFAGLRAALEKRTQMKRTRVSSNRRPSDS